ncbi:2-dehydropantoate 2-reductase [Paraburkholderia bannensis]|uniref:2-dehydropantoate 2-reductase n=1 Tax=Paraburkholderia bannensis TaxID=765414 RepID=A0A7W9WWJ3_9BURK|nr:MULTISPECIES: 2-dehydropantoate 2-reductase [Paraburkholderia]MBB3261501.1 2-dehydropantoate 2-reductase [Paraburkholderia sp. WP4_3_2]MBB6106557.1 2-dehydropantoate 2-reductase [Paraburkholderia bannensis]
MNASQRSITVVGAGAIGGLIAARLARCARNGTPVNVLARGAQLEAIRRDGLTVVESDDERYTARVNATHDAATLGAQDIVFVCLKGQALAQSAASLAPLVGPHTHIVSAMNGVPWWFLNDFGQAHANGRLESVDPGGVVSSALPGAQASGCVVHLSSSIAAPGVIRKGRGNLLIVGASSPRLAARAEEARALLAEAGFDVQAPDSIQHEIWAKLWGNMTMNPISALTRSSADVILDDPLTAQLVAAVMAEARTIGEALGIGLDMTIEERNAITRKLGAFKTSMLQDVEAGRTLEVQALLGAPYELAQRAGIAAPSLGMLYGLARQLDANLEAARRTPDAHANKS